jgi:hypothetical protein
MIVINLDDKEVLKDKRLNMKVGFVNNEIT